ncbi:MAG: hypothetical protein JOZ52_04150 [Acidobacteria bacterium]|nr:hypothetical protein [Acidobacteriota bacterium]
MKNQVALTILTALFILVFSFETFSQQKTAALIETSSEQKIEGLNLTVSVENTDLVLSQKPKIKVRLENKTGSTIYLDRSEPMWLNFESLNITEGNCKRSDCFFTFARFKDKRVENNKSIEAEFTLTDFYWMDMISSQIDFKRPKNFFQTVTFGKYRFYASLSIAPNAWTFDKSKYASVKSNEIKVLV